MRILVISDIHAQTFWKHVMEKAAPDDAVIFLGDYFDRRGEGPFANNQADNFLEICALARKRKNVHLLLGNHDWQYLPWDPYGCGGRNDGEASRFGKALMDNLDILGVARVLESGEGRLLFSHAGVSRTFMADNGLSRPEEIDGLLAARPGAFNFLMEGPRGQWSEPHGNDRWQGPLWIRPESLLRDMLPGFIQVVGHTVVREPQVIHTGAREGLVLTCTLDDTTVSFDAAEKTSQ